jgi:hypothetical protein
VGKRSKKKREKRRNNIFISNTDRGGGGWEAIQFVISLRQAQKIPTVARNSTKNRCFAKSHSIE